MDDFRSELIQVAAVAVAIITDLDYGTTAPPSDGALTPTARVLVAIETERNRQEAKWGAQHHSPAEWLAILGEEYGEACKAALDDLIFPKPPRILVPAYEAAFEEEF